MIIWRVKSSCTSIASEELGTHRDLLVDEGGGGGEEQVGVRAAHPDPDWIRIQLGQWIRMNPDPDPGGQNDPQK